MDPSLRVSYGNGDGDISPSCCEGAEKPFVPSQYSSSPVAELFRNLGLSYRLFKDLKCNSSYQLSQCLPEDPRRKGIGVTGERPLAEEFPAAHYLLGRFQCT